MIGIIHVGDLKYCPYLEKYEKILREENIEYEVLFWNRSVLDYRNETYISYNKNSKLKKNRFLKLCDFYGFRKWLMSMTGKGRYEKLILLSTLSGMLIAGRLIHSYPFQYIFDIRDYSYEKIAPFFLAEKRITSNSALNIISSEGFLNFLPPNSSYMLSHNIPECDEGKERKFKIKKNGMINIVWLGMIRYFKQQAELIRKLSQDGRFKLLFYGEGTELETFKKYVQENSFHNVYFLGQYHNKDKAMLLSEADIINNCYAVNMETRYAVSNKFYDGIFYHIPQLVEAGTYKGSLVTQYGVGIAMNSGEEFFSDKLYEFYSHIDEGKFNASCNELKNKFLQEEKDSIQAIKNFLADSKK